MGVEPDASSRALTASDSSTPYHIYASNKGQSGPDVLPEKIGDERYNTDAFVGHLVNKELVLESKPVVGTTTSVKLDTTDEWGKWLTTVDTSEATIEVKLQMPTTADSAPPVIESFKITLHKLGSTALEFESTQELLGATFGRNGGAGVSRVPPPGLLKGDTDEIQTLVCALNFTTLGAGVSTTVQTLFEWVGLSSVAKTVPSVVPQMEAKLLASQGGNLKRNAIWFDANTSYRTTTRLVFALGGDAFNKVKTLLTTAVPNFTIESFEAVATRITTGGVGSAGRIPVDQGQLAFSLTCAIEPPGKVKVEMSAGIEFRPNFAILTLNVLTKDAIARMVEWLASLAGIDIDIVKWLQDNADVFTHFQLRRLTLELNTPVTGNATVVGASLHVEVGATVGKKADDESVLFLLTYAWKRGSGFGTFMGRLWNDYDITSDRDQLPTYETWKNLPPLTTGKIAKSLDLKKVIPGEAIQNVPAGIPTNITMLSLMLSSTGLSFGASIAAAVPPPNDVPQIYLGQVTLAASFAWGAKSDFKFGFGIMAGLEPSKSAKDQTPGVLMGTVIYQKAAAKWALHGEIRGLRASVLYSFFDADTQDHLSELVNSIELKSLTIDYTYEGAVGSDIAKGSGFMISGALIVASLELDLDFERNATIGWKFVASLSTVNADATIGDILTSLLGVSEDDLGLPDLVTDTKFTGKSGDGKAFGLTIAKDKVAKNNAMYFTASMAIGPATLTFAQYRSLAWEATVPSKRLAKSAITSLPNISIPLVGDITQPFDEMSYMWVQDKSKKNPQGAGAGPGFTRAEVTLLNGPLTGSLVFKDGVKDPKPENVVLPAGSHLIVVIKTNDNPNLVVLDYVFMKPDPNAQRSLASSSRRSIETAPGDESSDEKAVDAATGEDKGNPNDTDGSSQHAPFKKKAGPLSISNIGLKYVNKNIEVMFDATFELGPIGFALLGFKLGLKFKDLHSAPDLSVGLEGLAASFDKPPLTIAGIIRHGKVGGVEYYAGGMIIGFKVYQFEAAGFYGIADGKGEKFHPIFVFARLKGPLVTLEFAEISGVTGGFGYRTDIRLPTVQQVTEFPFIEERSSSSEGNALDTLEKLINPQAGLGWFTPNQPGQPETYWGAVGLKVDAFQMISIDAVVVAEFSSTGNLKLGVFAVALADIPNQSSPIKIAHIELGILALLDTEYGLFKAEAQISPSSYIFHESCKLTGGFALYYWFDGPSANKARIGDWVFTIGGYHQAFQIPDGYPNPPRLGISWSIGSQISIRGEAYFAITPKCCMAGGRLRATFSAGPLEAFFDVFADFLINYKPFHFVASAGITVGVRFNIDFLFIHTHISVELSCRLDLWGPPLAGIVHVNFWIVQFDVHFGDSKKTSDPVSLDQFYDLAIQADLTTKGGSTRRAITASGEPVQKSAGEAHTFSAISGLLNPDQDKQDRDPHTPWVVRGGNFKCLIACKVALRSASFGNLDADGKPIPDPSDVDPSTIKDVFAKPMQLKSPIAQSKMRVNIISEELHDKWTSTTDIKSVPAGLWGVYDPSADPASSGNNINSLIGDTRNSGALPLRMGVILVAPPPELSQDHLKSFNAEKGMLEDIVSKDPFPAIENGYDDWTPEPPITDPHDDEKVLPEQWQKVHDVWAHPPNTGDDILVGWKNLFGWAGEQVANTAMPIRLKKRFMDSYVASPLVSVGMPTAA